MYVEVLEVMMIKYFLMLAVLLLPIYASAFNVYNNTDQEIIVYGNLGGYTERVKPGKVSKGWYTGDSIKIWAKWAMIGSTGMTYITETTSNHFTVPPHRQAIVSGSCKYGQIVGQKLVCSPDKKPEIKLD